MKLSTEGWKLLIEVVHDPKSVELEDDDPRVHELVDAGIITEEDVILWGDPDTGFPLGKSVKAEVIKLKEKLDRLQRGISLSERTKKAPNAMFEDGEIWYKNQHSKKELYISKVGDMLFIGPMRNDKVKIEKIPNQHIERLKQNITRIQKIKKWVEVIPYAYVLAELGGYEMIIMRTEKKDFTTAIQTKYYDFVMARYKTASWWVTPKMEEPAPVVAKIVRGRNVGIKGNVAMIMPVKLHPQWKPPNV